MYGIVNRAIEDLVVENYGTDRWRKIKEASGVDIDFFISNEPYDDSITYKLAQAAAGELGISINEVLNAFGEWWVLRTGKQKYGAMMEAGGSNLRQFLINLPKFHNRVILIYPKLTPPEFQVTDITDSSLVLHYISKRQGLHHFVLGLLNGLAKVFETKIQIDVIHSREQGDHHETYRISWPNQPLPES
jgi:hypothetical protein